MPTTAISTNCDNTKLTIKTSEVLNLEQMGKLPIRLNRGVNNVTVGKGVFKLSSTSPVSVTGDPSGVSLVILSTDIKDGSWPDPSALNVGAEGAAAVKAFFADVGAKDDLPD